MCLSVYASKPQLNDKSSFTVLDLDRQCGCFAFQVGDIVHVRRCL